MGYKKLGGWIVFFAAINRSTVNNYNTIISAEEQRKYLTEFSFLNVRWKSDTKIQKGDLQLLRLHRSGIFDHRPYIAT